MLLEANKDIPYFGNGSQLYYRIPYSVIFQCQQVGQFLLGQFTDSLSDIVVQNKREK